MKRLKNSLAVGLYQTVCSRGFLVCALITCGLCFVSVVYADSLNGREYTVAEIIAGGSEFGFLSVTAFDILQQSVNPYLTLFLPVLSSIPFAAAFCTERSSGNLRFTVPRTGKPGYCIAKFLTAMLSGGAVTASGFAEKCAVFTNRSRCSASGAVGLICSET